MGVVLTNEAKIGLFSKRILTLTEDNFKDKQINELIGQLVIFNFENKDPVTLLIDSDGGCVEAGFKFYDFLRCSSAPVTGVAIGQCKSMGIVILQGCNKRIATRHSFFALHSMKWKDEFEVLQNPHMQFRKEFRETKILQEKYINVLAGRSGTDKKIIRSLICNGDKFNSDFSPEKALTIGLIDEIVETYDLFS
ncbi:MAG: ATP-dependent Clp protease proteolytic subunit [Candidatus Niyogibacteria bacterium]|nr:ATP-dependent Clp protease proteolytic subunit [Candidatus Niyogibacteria bacterium]